MALEALAEGEPVRGVDGRGIGEVLRDTVRPAVRARGDVDGLAAPSGAYSPTRPRAPRYATRPSGLWAHYKWEQIAEQRFRCTRPRCVGELLMTGGRSRTAVRIRPLGSLVA